ncbi:MAG TPA: YraN family protein [Tissierellia bacterium]|nr:YraN family protein [Tissierellia bacterium]
MYQNNKGYGYENIAKKFLIDKNYEILEENFTSRFGEIDIIAEKDGRIHFIEVKGRIDTKYGYPREAVTLSKQKKLRTAAKYYFMLLGRDDFPCQFDIIEIILNDRKINHIENAF